MEVECAASCSPEVMHSPLSSGVFRMPITGRCASGCTCSGAHDACSTIGVAKSYENDWGALCTTLNQAPQRTITNQHGGPAASELRTKNGRTMQVQRWLARATASLASLATRKQPNKKVSTSCELTCPTSRNIKQDFKED